MEAAEHPFAEEYHGPAVPYDIPRAIPIEIDNIPVASVLVASDPFSLPVVEPIPSPDPIRTLPKPRLAAPDPIVSPTSVIRFDQDGIEVSGEIGSSCGGVSGSCGGVDGGSGELSDAAVGFSGEFKEIAGFSNDTTRPAPDRVSTESSEFGFCSTASVEEQPALSGNAKRTVAVTFENAWADEDTSSQVVVETSRQERREEIERKKGACYLCRGGNRFTDKEVCIVCNAKYCSSCVLRAMGSMPEGRKCVSCIGGEVEESKRERLGKCSRMLKRLLSQLETQQIMKAEKTCEANQLRADHVSVNGKFLSSEEMVLLMSCANSPDKLKAGHYWYDKVSGFWGKEGHKPHKIITPNLKVGGSLMDSASNGNTGIFINGREITKVEQRMLQLAGVQCAGKPHFWVNADGTYQEEGHKIIKGYLWAKPGMKLVCSFLSLPYPTKTTNNGGEDINDMITRSAPACSFPTPLQKLLLIGCHGTGTSTIFKQAKFLYKPIAFSEEERENIKKTIQSNIYYYLGILLEGRERFEEECLAERRTQYLEHQGVVGNEPDQYDKKTIYSICPKLKTFSDWLLKVMAVGSLEAIFPASTRVYSPLVKELWDDAAIQATYSRRNELKSLPSAASYFLERAVDISRMEYEPSDMDILKADGLTSSNGLAYTDFHFPSVTNDSAIDAAREHETNFRYQLIKMQTKGLGENCKWLDMFEDSRMVIFSVALSGYNELFEDTNGVVMNKMLASKRLFESVVNHPTFEQMDFLLILNKFDLLEMKIDEAPITVCDWFDDFNPVTSRNNNPNNRNHHNSTPAQQAFYYIAVKFKRLFSSLTGRKLYVTSANSLNCDTVDAALRYAREVLKWEEERTLLCFGDTSVYSTDPSSYSD